VVGAGGVGSAIAAALAAGGAADLVIHDISAAAASALAAKLAAHYPGTRTTAGGNDAAGRDLVVNASPLGMYDSDPMPVDASRLSPSTFVGEVVMKRTMTPLLLAAAARGCRYQQGVDMLYEQIPLYLDLFGCGRPSPESLRAIA
jgi:shikimate dehydrogenase